MAANVDVTAASDGNGDVDVNGDETGAAGGDDVGDNDNNNNNKNADRADADDNDSGREDSLSKKQRRDEENDDTTKKRRRSVLADLRRRHRTHDDTPQAASVVVTGADTVPATMADSAVVDATPAPADVPTTTLAVEPVAIGTADAASDAGPERGESPVQAPRKRLRRRAGDDDSD
jgi:hypothetical protein